MNLIKNNYISQCVLKKMLLPNYEINLFLNKSRNVSFFYELNFILKTVSFVTLSQNVPKILSSRVQYLAASGVQVRMVCGKMKDLAGTGLRGRLPLCPGVPMRGRSKFEGSRNR